MSTVIGQRVALPAQYGLTCLFVLPCLALRIYWPWHGFSFFLFVPAVLLGAALFGRGPAVLAAALTTLIAAFFWIDPVYSLRVSSQHLPAMALYVLVCAAIVATSEWSRVAFVRYRQSALDKPGATARPAARRLDSIDFWRGLVLLTIFVNHVPGNIFEIVTHRNFGFSDSAEAFVFLSGVSMALAYGGRYGSGRRLAVVTSLAQRMLKLYGVHIALSLAAIAIFSAGALYWRNPALMTHHGRELYVKDAWQCLIGIFSLGHQLGYFNILPLYIALIPTVPLFFWLSERSIGLMLTVSALIYAATRFNGWNLPSWPDQGGWFLDPLAWQFLMAIGIAIGLRLKREAMPLPTAPYTTLAAIIVAIGVVTSPYGIGPLRDWIAAHGPLDVEKGVLGLTRLSHFLALAYLIYALGISNFARRLTIYEPVAVLGRHSLLIFSLSSLLAAIGQILTIAVRSTGWFDVVFFGAGIAVLYGVACLADAAKAARRQTAKASPAAC